MSVKEKVKYLLWAKSAGRCQFDGCNKPLYQHDHTQIEMNFGEIAHIIGQGENGPRSYAELKQDKDYINDISNLMMACQEHHKLIDEHPEIYTPELLREMKRVHEDKIRLATEIKVDNTSNVIIYRGRVGSFQPTIEFRDAVQAMFPDYYPANYYAQELGMSNNLMEDDNDDFWNLEVENLEAQFSRKIERFLGNDSERNHYSIFAFASIPLLIKLGTLLPNKYPAQVYQLKKEPANWIWESEGPLNFDFIVIEPQFNYAIVALKLSLSGDIDDQKIYDTLQTQNVSICEMKIPDSEFPKDDHLRSKEQLVLS